MPQLNNAFDTFTAKGNREDLHDLIVMISPEETPLMSNIGEKPVKAVKTEWQTDILNAPDTNNAREQGYQYVFNSTNPTNRVGNYTQIFSKERLIAETQEVVDKAGRKSEVSYQKSKMGLEIRTDIEVTFLSNQASSAGSGATPARLGGARAWLASNDSMGSGGASGGYNQSTGAVDAATNGTKRAFTKTLLDNALQDAYTAGGNPKLAVLSPYCKRVFSTFMSDTNVAQFRSEVKNSPGTIVGAADAYLSDWGLIDMIPNRQMARVTDGSIARNIFLIDPTKMHKGFLRKIQEDKDVAKQGDAQPIVMKAEATLVVGNEAAHAVIADVYGMTSSL